MSIRIITRNNVVVGYQALAGAGGPGLTAYVPAHKQNAWAEANRLAVELEEIRTSVNANRPADPLRGLRLTLRKSKKPDTPPRLYVEARWYNNSRPIHRSYSTASNGMLDAVWRAVREVEAARGKPIGLPVQTVKQQLLQRYERKAQAMGAALIFEGGQALLMPMREKSGVAA